MRCIEEERKITYTATRTELNPPYQKTLLESRGQLEDNSDADVGVDALFLTTSHQTKFRPHHPALIPVATMTFEWQLEILSDFQAD